MTYQLLNPLIHQSTTDTLNCSKNCISYIQESMSDLQLAEVSEEARQGLFWFLECLTQALAVEADRTLPTYDSSSSPQIFRPLHEFEIALFKKWAEPNDEL